MNNINPNTQTAEIKGPQAAQPSFQMPIDDLQHAYDELSKMSAPRAAEIKGPQAAQPSFQMPIDDLQRAYDELSKMSAPRAAEIKGPQAAQPDYLREYKPRRR